MTSPANGRVDRDPKLDRKASMIVMMLTTFLVIGLMDLTARFLGNFGGSKFLEFQAIGDWYIYYVPGYYSWLLLDAMIFALLAVAVKDSCFTTFAAIAFHIACCVILFFGIWRAAYTQFFTTVEEGMEDSNEATVGLIRFFVMAACMLQFGLLVAAEKLRENAMA